MPLRVSPFGTNFAPFYLGFTATEVPHSTNVNMSGDKDKEKEEVDNTIAADIVVTKYKMAGEMVNRKCAAVALSVSVCGNVWPHRLTRVYILSTEARFLLLLSNDVSFTDHHHSHHLLLLPLSFF